jgi:hypothetical protein
MQQLTQALMLFILVMATVGFLMGIEKYLILPKKDAMLRAQEKAKQKRYRARRLCSQHIVCLNVHGSMAVLDEFGCYLCARERIDENG